ncbi:uncharacterized protein LOC113233892 [Hyposmocoma kahamanoa]|uniref:uncharacterized protein LOC113233892 n=1 Tax=Hyposmocoma kahamanoa TaxID=1477025 RepID=UPI000E6D72AB|nr:uncharacterized protein LOC113233892 [Hyposmocoma kahamanoa]
MNNVLYQLGFKNFATIGIRSFSVSKTNNKTYSCKLLVLGGGSGGCTIAAKFSRNSKVHSLIILEPSCHHYYQPLWTLVGAGVKKIEATRRNMKSVLPSGPLWLKDSAVSIDPVNCKVTTALDDIINYEYLVVAVGLKNDYEKIPGLLHALENSNVSQVSTIYDSKYAENTFTLFQKFKGGEAVFTYPDSTIKCPGAPQKIAYLADSYFTKKGVRSKANITYNTALPVIFGVKKYADALLKVVERKRINVGYRSVLREVRGPNHEAVFDVFSGNDPNPKSLMMKYDMLHVTPHMSPPSFLKANSELVDSTGYLDVDKSTLQHTRHPNIFGIGDCTNTPNSKTAAAIAKQCYVLEKNLTNYMEHLPLTAQYDGYGACPLVTSYRTCIVAEFLYGGIVRETLPKYSNCRCKLLIVGGGTGGCSVAWRFANKVPPKEIIYHYYQPMFTLVAAGIKNPDNVYRPLKSVLPNDVVWLKDHAEEFDPGNCMVYTRCGDKICYEYLVIAVGMVNEYDQITGLKEALDHPNSGVTTIYSKDYIWKTWCCIKCHQGGHAVFTYPCSGGKCAGAAQKIMYLADDYWRRHKIRHASSITYNTGRTVLFGVPKYGTALRKVACDRNIAINYNAELVEVKPQHAIFCIGTEKDGYQFVNIPYNLLHVTPPMCPPECLRNCSALVNGTGFLDVDKHTLQHVRYNNVYGLGDCTTTPNSKTASAIGPQSYVVEQNLWQTMNGCKPKAAYNGYGSCPVLTSYRKGILTEFTYDKKLAETFPFDQSKERRFFYYLKNYLFPYVYWNKLIKGKWNGPHKIRSLLNPFNKVTGNK